MLKQNFADADPDKKKVEFMRMMTSWVGVNATEIIRSWGPPTSTFKMPNDSTMYTWHAETQGASVIEKNYYPALRTVVESNTASITYFCDRNFEVRPDGIIAIWQYSGNACY